MIAVVDDEENVRRALQRLFRSAGQNPPAGTPERTVLPIPEPKRPPITELDVVRTTEGTLR